MKVPAINNLGMQNKPSKNSAVNFNAYLKVLSSAESVIKGDLGKFREVCYW